MGNLIPTDRRYYTKNGAHLWLKEENGTLKVGMDAFMAEHAGFLTFLTIREGEVSGGEPMGNFESAKFVSRLYAPVSGRIVSVNREVLNNPRKINEDPYGSWIVTIEAEPGAEAFSEHILKGEEETRKWIKDELEKVE